MPEISKREKQLDWICRILMTIDVIIILDGYINFFQTKYQLTSPLIPKTTIYQILEDSNYIVMKASIISAIIFLAGLWLYSFRKKLVAIVLFSLSVFCFWILQFSEFSDLF